MDRLTVELQVTEEGEAELEKELRKLSTEIGKLREQVHEADCQVRICFATVVRRTHSKRPLWLGRISSHHDIENVSRPVKNIQKILI